LHGKTDRQRHGISSGSNRRCNAFAPRTKQRRADHLHAHFRELLAHAHRHEAGLVGKLARVDLRIDPYESIDIAHRCSAVCSDQRDPVAAPCLLHCGARERPQRDCISNDAFLDGGLQTGRKRKPADGEHRVAKLQHPRE
jgi:hypothetical protein